MDQFRGRTAVVTGAASGIGKGLTERFAAEGMNVVLADVEQAPLEAAAQALRDGGAQAIAVRTDVSDAVAVAGLADAAYERFGAVHVLCNNAGVGAGGSGWEQTLDDWRWVLGVNLWGVIYGIHTFVPRMLAGGDEGHIVNTASVAGLIAGAGNAAYTATKAGVVGMSEILYHELAATGGKVGISVLCPALTNTCIIEADRNRPSGPTQKPAPGTPEAMMWEGVKAYFATGMSPATVADIVLDAIKAKRFYILTHPEHNERYRLRAEAMIAGDPPPLIA